MLKDNIRKIIEIQKEYIAKNGLIRRDIEINTKTSQITIITGVRRCGKSTLLYQTLKNLNNTGTLNFEDPRLREFTVSDFLHAEEIFQETSSDKYLFFDEIQNIPEWERYIRMAHDKGKTVFVTGSNASMLSSELGTKLTGRYKSIELFPFSFDEFLKYTKKSPSSKSLYAYLKHGGFPEYLKEKDPEYLQRLFLDIISRDIIVRKGIKNEGVLLSLANFLISNVGKIFSFNRISKQLGIKSVRSAIDYCQYLRESYLFELIPSFTSSITKQILNPKKVYAIDTGLINANTLSFSEDLGRILENSVFLHLRRRYKKIYYFKDESECDFIINEKNQNILAIQVCYELNDSNLKREMDGLKEALKKTKAKKGLIITFDQEDKIDGIKIVSAWKWFLEGNLYI